MPRSTQTSKDVYAQSLLGDVTGKAVALLDSSCSLQTAPAAITLLCSGLASKSLLLCIKKLQLAALTRPRLRS